MDMHKELDEFNEAARILGRKYVPELLEELSDGEWVKASDLAAYVDISTATAVSYLKDLKEIGVLEKRKKKGMTGQIKEFRLSSPDISLETKVE